MRILIAEDDQNSRFLLKKFVDQHGECDVAVDGEEAIKKFHESLDNNNPYQLIFLDIMMPKYSGFEVMEQIRNREQAEGRLGLEGVSIVMTTALDDEEKIFDAHVSGCFNYLIKPLSKSMVVEQIKIVEQNRTDQA